MDRKRFFSQLIDIEGPSIMAWLSERAVQGVWSHPNVPLLIFADSSLPGTSVTLHGGPVASAAPVQLLFWGSWWSSPEGGQRLWMIEDRLKGALASNYFSELAQYGVAAPHFRGSLIVKKPSPPMSFPTEDDEHSVGDMIVDLIENDVFPDPDDEQIAYLVLMPKGFAKPASGTNGAHTRDYDYEFPFDIDWFWWGWIRYFDDSEADDTTRTLTHELTELLTDPTANDGWYAGTGEGGEIADAANVMGTYQTVWVNGTKVTSYWSNRHSATVIPIDRDYRARIIGSISLQRGGRHELERGTFRPSPADTAFCKDVRACCIEDRDYAWVVNGLNETATLRVETQRYRQPIVTWTINGQPIKGGGSISVDVDRARYKGRSLVTTRATVSVQFAESKGTLEIKTKGIDANFDLYVACAVRDGSITGNVRTDVIATPSAVIGFVGSELVLDPEYVRQRDACHEGISKFFRRASGKTKFKRPRPGEPVELDPVLLAEVPAWARVREFERARQAVVLAKMVEATFPRKTASVFIKSLVAETAALTAVEERPLVKGPRKREPVKRRRTPRKRKPKVTK